jgi:hypothetical protein
MVMRDEMPEWKEMSIVFRDERTLNEAWPDTDMKFQELTSRQKRMGYGSHAVMYARKYTKFLNQMSDLDGDDPIQYKFVVVEKAEDDLEITFENLSVLG